MRGHCLIRTVLQNNLRHLSLLRTQELRHLTVRARLLLSRRLERTPTPLLRPSSFPVTSRDTARSLLRLYQLLDRDRRMVTANLPRGGVLSGDESASGERKRKRLGTAKFYGVASGRNSGVYTTWADCLAQVKGVKGSKFKSFATEEEAQQFVAGNDPSLDPTSDRYVQKFYGVRSGKLPGVYNDWASAKAQVIGVVKPKVRVFSTRAEAEEFVRSGLDSTPTITPTTTAAATTSPSTLAPPPLTHPISPTTDSDTSEPPTKKTRPSSSSNTSLHSPTPSLSATDIATSTAAAIASTPSPNPPAPKPPSTLLHIYTDGSALGNGRTGSRAGIGVYFGDSDARNISEPLAGPRQTNQRAELTAILRAIEVAPKHRPVLIYTDSQYAIKCVTVWHQSWERNNWKNSKGQPVENRDLVERILDMLREREMEGRRSGGQTFGKGGWTRFEWVKGHTGYDDGNSKADQLAVAGARQGL